MPGLKVAGAFRSIQARMLALSAVAILVALALAGWAIGGVLERVVVAGLDRRLDSEVAVLASVVDADGRIDAAALARRAGALEDRPGWRWRIAGAHGAIGSADFPRLDPAPPRGPDGRRGPPPDDGARIRPLDGGGHGGRVHARRLVVPTRAGPVTITAAAPRDVVRRPIRGAVAPLLATLAALAVLLAAATLVQLRLGLRPLRRLGDQVAAIRAGARTAVDPDQPAELAPLAAELNALAAANRAALAAARASAANLAHALKTPVATLALDLRDDPARSAQVARIDAVIRHHLARARAEAIDRRHVTPLAPAVAGLVAAVRALHAGRRLAIEATVGDGVALAVDPTDVDELIGNLLDNAARHAASRVTLAAARDPDDPRRVRIAIADDGPGIPDAARDLATRPGARLDERGDGHGFGLAIVADLAGLYGGALTLGEAPGGGLLAWLTLPAADPVQRGGV